MTKFAGWAIYRLTKSIPRIEGNSILVLPLGGAICFVVVFILIFSHALGKSREVLAAADEISKKYKVRS